MTIFPLPAAKLRLLNMNEVTQTPISYFKHLIIESDFVELLKLKN